MKPSIQLATEIEFEVGQPIFHRIGKDAGFITGIMLRTGISYLVTWGDKQERYHFGFELSSEIEPELQKSTNETREAG